MFEAIVENMESHKKKGDLFQGSITTGQEQSPLEPDPTNTEFQEEQQIQEPTQEPQQQQETEFTEIILD